MRLSLAAKGLLLVSIPLLFEIGFVIVLVNLQRQAEAESAIALRSKQVAHGISRLTGDLFDLWEVIFRKTKKQWVETGTYDQSYKEPVAKLAKEYQQLANLTVDDPVIHKHMVDQRKNLLETERILDSVIIKIGTGKPTSLPEEVETVKQLQTMFRDLALRNQQIEAIFRRTWADKKTDRQTELREETLKVAAIAAVVNVLLSIAMAIFLLKDVTGRLSILRDNSARLASGLQLRAPLQGNDEIAEVDRVFRQMAHSIADSNHKERAVIENAIDTICAIDKDGRFTTANPASFKLFHIEPEDLIGSRLIDFIAEEDRARMVEWIANLRSDSSAGEQEFAVVRRDGGFVDTLWSGYWSASEKSLFVVVHDITDRKELERAKQELVAMLTHDLRSPLTTVLGMIEMANAGMLGDLNERGVRLVKSAERNSFRMLSLINDLLDIEKIKSGTMQLSCERVLVQDLFNEVQMSCADWLAENNITLDCTRSDLALNADKEKLSRVIFNLVSNAIKFSPPGGSIKLQAISSGKSVDISVTDQGPGIPPDMVSLIFERFQQVSAATHQGKGGTGLGLAICKAIVDLHGGKIWVTNVGAPGSGQSGSSFHVLIERA
jgi:PAS domain S-box-containing protein